MEVPTGIVSLAVNAGLKSYTVYRQRRRHKNVVKRLEDAVDAGDLKIRNADAADATMCREVLLPLVRDGAEVLERFSSQKMLGAVKDATDAAPDDIEAAKKLIDAFNNADSAIELRRILRRIDTGVGTGNEANVASIRDLQRDVTRLQHTVQICMVSVVFFRGGEAGVSPRRTQKL